MTQGARRFAYFPFPFLVSSRALSFLELTATKSHADRYWSLWFGRAAQCILCTDQLSVECYAA